MPKYRSYTAALTRGLLLLLVAACASTSTKVDKGLVTRAAFDVGSGSTKVKVGKVDLAAKKLVEIVYPTKTDDIEQVKVAYRDALAATADKTIPEATITDGIAALNILKKMAENAGATEFVGVATAAFRDAKNGAEVVARLSKETGIPITVVSQEEEARIGFLGATARSGVDPKTSVVWDIGGGSQEMAMLGDDGKLVTYKGKLGSDVMKQFLIEKLKKGKVATPNPIGPKGAKLGLAEAKKAAADVPKPIVEKIAKADTVVLGIGGVHHYSLREQALAKGQEKYTAQDVKAALEKKQKAGDGDIGGKFPANQVANLVLVLGYLEALKIPSVKPLAVNLADGLLVP